MDGTLRRLLLDPHDTAVTQITAEALLRRGDTAGLRPLLAALGTVTRQDTADQLAAELRLACSRWECDERIRRLARACATLAASDPDTTVRATATAVLGELGLDGFARGGAAEGEAGDGGGPPGR